MKWDPKMKPLLVKGVVAVVALVSWYFLGKPIDETEIKDVVELLSVLLIGKEFLPQTGKP
jgi:hypothetical protein